MRGIRGRLASHITPRRRQRQQPEPEPLGAADAGLDGRDRVAGSVTCRTPSNWTLRTASLCVLPSPMDRVLVFHLAIAADLGLKHAEAVLFALARQPGELLLFVVEADALAGCRLCASLMRLRWGWRAGGRKRLPR